MTGSMFTEYDRYLFGAGTHYEIYRRLGAHPGRSGGISGVYFALWAPHATAVSVVGDFNGWDPAAHMMKHTGGGIFELFIPGAAVGSAYRYCIRTMDSRLLYKADPYSFRSSGSPSWNSLVWDIDRYIWQDQAWMADRCGRRRPEASPCSVYEVHPGSWRRHGDGSYYTYEELAEELTVYVSRMGYTHVEFIGIAEYPYDPSWGYQVTGYYAPTFRYGDPDGFKLLVDRLHQAGIGVILDWVPAHFPKDACGLADFDGTSLYEYADPQKREHPQWGTRIFDYSRKEVTNFLIASGLFWADIYHVDGIRVDAVASMLYLDFGRGPGEWTPNARGGNENPEAVEFLKHFNSILKQRFPGVITAAEESTTWPGVTKPARAGGLGFTFKWNMGWMHDYLDYLGTDPIYRKFAHHKMTFALTYQNTEDFILVLSHDEVVHLKHSMLEKLPGDDFAKISCLKAAYTFFLGHPGKKLLFMGQEFGQHREWSEDRGLDWELLDNDAHRSLSAYFRDLLHLYRKYPCLYQDDRGYPAFCWMDADDCDNSVYSFVRYSARKRRNLLFVCHFTPVMRPGFRIGVPGPGNYTLLLNETAGLFGPGRRKTVYMAEPIPAGSQDWSICLDLKGYGAMVFGFCI